MIIATGAEYRRPGLANLSQFEGAGVYYTAMPMEAQLCIGEEVIVVGGGNSAGQAAVFLAQTAKRVFMLVRREGLADTMSRYLIRRIEDNPAIVLRTHTQLIALDGNGHLERVQWRDDRTGDVETKHIRHVFLMLGRYRTPIGSSVRGARWQRIHQDGAGPVAGRSTSAGGTGRPPYLLETSRPGVFAVGDVRGGNVKRVASAVGEGSIAIAFVHQVLRQ